ncbi:hypothetical protein HPB50_000875 [Hyalomma asiaticum]|uniref:Uncharacterized protein n=1 Tax=Hyalomma asiaticum TaxID=266040 RepID=A0ACB7S9T3_HYAAI|nr:hypothetical protein HPB50_000875 [Hyalomma asiaticum]
MGSHTIIKILKAEYWRQVGLFSDHLRVILAEEMHRIYADRRFCEYKKLAAQKKKFLWHVTRVDLPLRQEKTPQNNVTVIGNCSLPDGVRSKMDKPPKYSFSAGSSHSRTGPSYQQSAVYRKPHQRRRLMLNADVYSVFLAHKIASAGCIQPKNGQ